MTSEQHSIATSSAWCSERRNKIQQIFALVLYIALSKGKPSWGWKKSYRSVKKKKRWSEKSSPTTTTRTREHEKKKWRTKPINHWKVITHHRNHHQPRHRRWVGVVLFLRQRLQVRAVSWSPPQQHPSGVALGSDPPPWADHPRWDVLPPGQLPPGEEDSVRRRPSECGKCSKSVKVPRSRSMDTPTP